MSILGAVMLFIFLFHCLILVEVETWLNRREK
jgi:hypothetical protein